MSDPLLEIRDLSRHFPVRKGFLHRAKEMLKAVDGVSFSIRAGETLGLVGESGCGKTTIGRTLLRLLEPSGGTIHFDGRDVTRMPAAELRRLRQQMQIVFQDPYSSLNPRMTVRGIVEEGLLVHGLGSAAQRLARVREVLEKVGLEGSCLDRYPHEFSGGQRQRISIARALALSPRFLVLDEPNSALDVSIQSQVINLLNKLKAELKLTYLFISHDLAVVEYISDRVAVMYLGEIVELATSQELYRRPLHPYTQALLSSIPVIDPAQRRARVVLPGDVPSPLHPPAGCRFHPRCPLAVDICRHTPPQLLEIDGHQFRCHVTEQQVRSQGITPRIP